MASVPLLYITFSPQYKVFNCSQTYDLQATSMKPRNSSVPTQSSNYQLEQTGGYSGSIDATITVSITKQLTDLYLHLAQPRPSGWREAGRRSKRAQM